MRKLRAFFIYHQSQIIISVHGIHKAQVDDSWLLSTNKSPNYLMNAQAMKSSQCI